ncbi:MAG: MarR family transcriptional regulator [Firmicutes bacterium]|nr:MarR family transcriptional regulator [Bacillota bacterium]
MENDELSKELFENFIAVSKLPFRKMTLEFSKGELAVLYQLYKLNRGMSAGELTSLIGVGSGRMADALKSLEAKKLILRQKDARDKRKTIVYLSGIGKETVEKRSDEVMTHIKNFTNELGAKDAEEMNSLMSKIVKLYGNNQ